MRLLRRDPGVLLLLLRQLSPYAPPSAIVPERFLEPRLLESAQSWFLNDRGRWVDWRHPAVLPVYLTALAIAHQARILAKCCGGNEFTAWVAGMLAPLGWFAVAAVDPASVAACRSDPNFAADPAAAQTRCWGLDHAAIARRLIQRWQLPEWLGQFIDQAGQPWSDWKLSSDFQPSRATSSSSLPDWATAPIQSDCSKLLSTVQLGVVLAEWEGFSLGLGHRVDGAHLQLRLGIGPETLLAAEDSFRAEDFGEAFEPEWQDPRLAAELSAAIQSAVGSQAAQASLLALYEADRDCLREALARFRETHEEQLRHEKLAALAEFAAGASHEINNPLAVISGQSQYLLKDDWGDSQRQALESIVRQTQRIHAILAELMQFARPPRLDRQRLNAHALLSLAVEAMRGLAGETGVKIHCVPPAATLWVDGDPRHLQTALGCLIRNAIEAAAPGKGCVRVSAYESGGNVEFLVEDSGPGPGPAERPHLFDVFYSGRSAGRGRGLGLPTAWRLAREHGGDVRFEPQSGGPTRFVLTLPLPDAAEQQPSERKSA